MLIDIDIETLATGGRGLGRHDGKAVFVSLAAPGDRLRCRVVHSHAYYDEAAIDEVITPSPVRCQPPCPVFGECGGCQWQHLPYATQLQWKERLFRDQLLRAGVAPVQAFLPIVPAPSAWGYRNRVQFKCRMTRQGFVSGFYRQGSHFVVDTPACLLVMPAIQDTYALLREVLPGAPHPEAIPQIDIGCSDDQRVTVLFHLLPEAVAVLREWLRDLAARSDFAVAMQVGRKETIVELGGDSTLMTLVDDPPLALTVGAGGFSQVNPAQNRELVKAVVAAAALSGGERVLDLFCGVGNFTLPLARRSGSAVGIENYAPAIRDAIGNAARHHLDNVRFFAEPAQGAALRHGRFDLVLLDPPRTGAYAVMRELLAMQPERILYVSCDPATLARDLKPLVHGGYAVGSCQPFDLFPQSWHIESLSVLHRVV